MMVKMKQHNLARVSCLAACLLLCCAGQPHAVAGWQGEDEERDVYYDYRNKRPKKKRGANRRRANAATPKAALRYVRKSLQDADPMQQGRHSGRLQKLGVTIWRLRASEADEEEVRIFDETEPGAGPLTPVRVESDTKFAPDDRVRLSVESPMRGYLYVINRELYAGGQLGPPYLVFPNMLTRNGDNRVRAGILVDLPSNGDELSFFRMKPSRPAQVGELLIIVVSARPLDVPPLELRRTPLDAGRVERWVKVWGTQPARFELEGGAGKAWTKEEKAASLGETRELIQDEPGPQTIFRVAVRPGSPLLVSLPLLYEGSPAKER